MIKKKLEISRWRVCGEEPEDGITVYGTMYGIDAFSLECRLTKDGWQLLITRKDGTIAARRGPTLLIIKSTGVFSMTRVSDLKIAKFNLESLIRDTF